MELIDCGEKISENCVMRLVIPGKPPTENHMWFYRQTKNRGMLKLLKPGAQAWFDEARLTARQAAIKHGWRMPEPGQWVKLKLKFIFPNGNHPDPTNCLKVFLDALQGEIYPNDKWVLVDLLEPEFDRDKPRTEIEVLVG
jgi:crossover junction endodeoxyribonuclease RusA